MFSLLARCIAFIAGLVLLADIALPIRTERLQVDRHTSHVDNSTTTRSGDTSYTLHLIGGRLSSCSVGHAAYQALSDGDTVEVQSTRLFKGCIRIAQGEEVVESDKHWKWFALISGGLLIGVALGWLRSSTDDDEPGVGFRLR